jgi:hypothetical protein
MQTDEEKYTWKELEKKFEALSEPLKSLRLDYNWGDINPMYLLAGGHNQTVNTFKEISFLAGNKLIESYRDNSEFKEIFTTRDPLIVWYNTLRILSGYFKLELVANQKDGEITIGKVYHGSINNVVSVSASMCMRLTTFVVKKEDVNTQSKDTEVKNYNFKKHKLSQDEKLWLTELLKFNFDTIDARSVKVNLLSKLSANFNPAKIDFRFAKDNRVTLLGLWYIQPKHRLIETTHSVIEQIKLMIIIEPKLEQIESKVITSILEIAQRDVQIIFAFLYDMGFCNGGSFVKDSKILEKINFQQDQDAFDKILYYKGIENTLENFYNQFSPQLSEYSATNQTSALKFKIKQDQNVWNAISDEFKISKQTFGKKINFVTDQFKRKIIFRDVEDAFSLYKNGFSKPAIILAGGVIEELLRLYLEHKEITTSKKSFDEYIKQCENNKLLKVGVSRLTDSSRYFRNLVHLEKEVDSKTSPSQSMASSVVASIFTIVNEF